MVRTFLVTGASKGIGLALSRRLARDGHHVVGIARRGADDIPGTLVSMDLADSGATGESLQTLAGRFAFDASSTMSVSCARNGWERSNSWRSTRYAGQPLTAVQAVQALLPGMTARGWGRIVNVSSLTVLGAVERTAYAAAKAALVSSTRNWGFELATTEMTVNAVAPGPTETELFRDNDPPGSEGERRYLAAVRCSDRAAEAFEVGASKASQRQQV